MEAIFLILNRLSGNPPFDEEKGSIYEQIRGGKIDFSNSTWNEISKSGEDKFSFMSHSNIHFISTFGLF